MAPPAPTPTPTTPAFANIPVTANNLTQGDLPYYAPPGSSNTRYSTLDAGAQASGYQVPLVQWNVGGAANLNIAGGGIIGSKISGFFNQPTYYSKSAALQAYAALSPDAKTAVQKQLLAAGYYPSTYYATATGAARQQPAYGQAADMDTFSALTNAIDIAIAQGQPLDTVLSSTSAAAQAAAQVYQQSTQVGQFDQSDPAEIRGLADQYAVSTLGRKATDAEKAMAVAMVQGAQVAQQRAKFEEQLGANRSDLASKLAGGVTGGAVGGAASVLPGMVGSLNAFMQATSGQESGGSYTSTNTVSGAAGKYQIMPANWPSWSQAAGLGPNAPQTPANQEIVARNQMSVYFNDLQDWGAVAVAWYAGEGTAKAFLADPTNPKWKVPQPGGNPSIYDYAKSVVGRMNTVASAPGSTTGALTGAQAPNPLAGEVGSIKVRPVPTNPTAADIMAGYSGGALEAGSIGVTNPNAPQGTAPGTLAGTQPTPAQIMPGQESIYTQVNPSADIAELLRRQNPQGAGAHDIASALDAVRTLFHG